MADRLEIARYYDFLIRKIDHEDTLIHYRTQWSLTLQGFLFAAFSLVVASDEFARLSNKPHVAQEIMADFLFLVAIAGAISAAATTRGITAALDALKLLKKHWETTYDAKERAQYPNPYLPSDHTGWTFEFAYRMPRYLTIVWAALLAITVVYGRAHGSYAMTSIGVLTVGLFDVVVDLAQKAIGLIS